jgi:hypothetical protein
VYDTAHLGTFDAERWWRPIDLADLPAVAGGGSVATMDELLAAYCGPDDLLLTRAPMTAGLRAGLAAAGIRFTHRFVEDVSTTGGTAEALVRQNPRLLANLRACRTLAPYAVLPDTAVLAADVNRMDQLPPVVTVGEVNSKVWSNDVVCDLGLAGAATVVRSAAELVAAVTACEGPAVVKDPFGVSGRGLLEIDNPRRLDRISAALDRQYAQGRRIELLVQDRYVCRTNFSAQLTIGRDGSVEVLGVQVMENDGFRYAGSAPGTALFVQDLTERGYFDTVTDVAKRLAAAGYHGPACIDSALLADDTVVPVFEVNARRSMGLLCLTLQRRFHDSGLTCRLVDRTLRVAPGLGLDDLLDALHAQRLLYQGNAAPGVLVLSGSGLAPPSARVYLALFERPGTDLTPQVTTALAARGFTAAGVVRAV